MNILKTYHEIASTMPENVTLVVVTKGHEMSEIRQLIEVGHRHFGENYIQEATEKWTQIKQEFPDITLHFLGHLQSNKASQAVELFDIIETVDSLKLFDAIKAATTKLQRPMPKLFAQINIGDEPQKSGVSTSKIDQLIQGVNGAITGVMCVPPANIDPNLYFLLTSKIAEQNGVKNISMGMSSDYQAAIKLGSTEVRIGSLILGSRTR